MMISVNVNELVLDAAREAVTEAAIENEIVLQAVVAEANRKITQANDHIQELGGHIEDSDAVIDVLVEDNKMLRAEIQKAGAKIEKYEAILEMLPAATAVGISLEEVIALVEKMQGYNTPAGYATHFDAGQKEQPECCAAGHCGTDKCGGNCHTEAKLGNPFTLGEYEAAKAAEDVFNAFRFMFLD